MGVVVMVEDDGDVRKLYSHILRKAGHEVIERHDARGLLELVLDLKPQVVLLDLSLPGENGVSACRRLKSNPMTASTRVVMLTGHDSFEATRQTTEAGADRHLTKPIAAQALLACVGPPTRVVQSSLMRRLRRAFGA